ncbi:MAG: cation-translocating P-type ATPase, partial [Bacteroidetes bacterium]|nr:cation-translocating P-type ATPase [Bacteroidota bacterium]
MHTQTYNVKGMHCASCSSVIEKTFKKVEGVHSAEVNYGTEKAKVSFDPAKTSPHDLSKHIEPLGYSLEVPETAMEMGMSESEHAAHLGLNQSKKEKLAEVADMRTKVLSAIPLAIFAALVMGWDILAEYNIVPAMSYTLKEFFHHLLPIFATYILFVVGKPYLLGFYRFLRYGKANMDTLIGIGTVAAFLYSFAVSAFEDVLKPFINVEYQYYDVTIVVITFIALGKYLEARSKIKTGDAIEKLLNLQAKTALVVRDGKEVEISVNDVKHGDLIIVKPGAKIPVDGVITEGSSFIDESMVTGEPMPAQKKIGDNVVSGTINTSGSFTF